MDFSSLLDEPSARALVAQSQTAAPGDRRGEEATARLLTAFHPMIDCYVAKFAWAGVDRDDLAQEAQMALWRAVVTYDQNKGAAFWRWAAWWVRGMCSRLARRTRREPHRVGIDVDGGISSDRLAAVAGRVDGADAVAEASERQRLAAEVVAGLEGLFVTGGAPTGDPARHERMRLGHPAVRGRIARRMARGEIGR